MNIFGEKVFFDKKLFEEEFCLNKLLVKEDQEVFHTNNFPHRLHLQNSQNRVVNIFSSEAFSNLTTNQQIIFEIEDFITFYWKINSREISYFKAKDVSEEKLNYWLIHTVIPLKLVFDNKYYFLHAGSIQTTQDSAVLFCANSYGGKSTLTDFFIKKNHTMLSDDKVATFIKDDTVFGVPSYPFARAYRKVEDLGVEVKNFSQEEKKIKCIYNLVKSEAKSDIIITEKSGIEKFMIVKKSTDIELFSIYKKERFETLTKLSNMIKVYDITIPWDLNRLEEVYTKILNHAKGLK